MTENGTNEPKPEDGQAGPSAADHLSFEEAHRQAHLTESGQDPTLDPREQLLAGEEPIDTKEREILAGEFARLEAIRDELLEEPTPEPEPDPETSAEAERERWRKFLETLSPRPKPKPRKKD